MHEEIAQGLLDIKAVFLRPNQPFVWASGIKSPIYCDLRLTLSYPRIRTMIETGLKDLIDTYYPACEVLMGTSTAGIAHAAITGHLMELPMGYVRGSNKDHGRQNRIEGAPVTGKKVVVIEDLISTGGSVLEVVDALKAEGADVLGIVSIFSYGMKKSKDRFIHSQISSYSLLDLDTVCACALKAGYLSTDEVAQVKKFRDNPADESWIGVN